MKNFTSTESTVNNKDIAWNFGRMIDAIDAVKPRSNCLVKQTNPDKLKWLNHDRIWNLVFWFCMSFGTLISFFLTPKANSGEGFSYLALAVLLITLIGIPLIVRSCSNVTFVKEDIFVNSEGRELKVPKDIPIAFFVIVCTVGSMILIGLLCDKYKISGLISGLIAIPLCFAIPTLFFIFKNCPISILFNRKVWSVMAKVKGSGDNFNHLHSATLSNTDAGWRNSASYYYRPGNIYYDRNR